MKNGDVYRMWYGANHSNVTLSYAESQNGIEWTKTMDEDKYLYNPNLKKVEWNFEKKDIHNWELCNIEDGSYDGNEEEIECDLSNELNGEGSYTIYLRYSDSNDMYIPVNQYEEITFYYDITPPDPTKYNGYESGINVSEGQLIKTNPYRIKLSSVDNLSGVDYVEFYIDDILICTVNEVSEEGLYECDWDTSKYHSDVKVLMYDRAGNVSELLVNNAIVDLRILYDTGIWPIWICFMISSICLLVRGFQDRKLI